MTSFEPSQRVLWWPEEYSGWDTSGQVLATVVKVIGERIQIQVKRQDGETVLRWVNHNHLEIPGSGGK